MSELSLAERKLLIAWSRYSGIVLSKAQVRLLGIFLNELGVWNRRINLTGIKSRERIVRELILDSILPSRFLPDKGRFLDVGSGAGFPAIPLKICKPDLKAHLLEPNSRKAAFLKQILRLTKIPHVQVFRRRFPEQHGVLDPEGYDIITSRAWAPLPQLAASCAEHLRPGGLLVTFHGSEVQNTLRENLGAIKKYQLLPLRIVPYTLPGKTSRRTLLILEKYD